MKLRWLVWLFCVAAGGQAGAAGQSPERVVELPAFHVAASLANVVVSPRFEGGGMGREQPARIICLVVQSVKAGTVAAKAGLGKGMEIHALQGTLLRGLTEAEVLDVMQQPVVGELVLKVRRPGGLRLYDLAIPVARTGAKP